MNLLALGRKEGHSAVPNRDSNKTAISSGSCDAGISEKSIQDDREGLIKVKMEQLGKFVFWRAYLQALKFFISVK